MKIEPLKKEDINNVAYACIEYAKEIGEPYDVDHIFDSLSKNVGKLPILVAKNESGEVVGVSAFICVPHIFNPKIYQGKELIWHTSPKLGKIVRAKLQMELLEIMISTCEKEGISLSIHIDENSSMRKLLRKKGFHVKNVQWVKEN